MKYLLLSLLLILSCSPKKNKQPESSNESQPLIFLHYWSEDMGGGINQMMRTFNSFNPGYEIKATGFDHESFKISMKVMLAGGNPPDLFSYWAGARTESLIKQGYLSPITDLWKRGNLDSMFTPTISESCHYKEVPYIIPVTQHYVSFFYNKKVFEELNITPPQSWKEFLQVCEKIKSSNYTPIALGSQNLWPAQFWFDYLLLRTAGSAYREALMNGEASYSDPEVKYAFSLWKDLLEAGYFNESPQMQTWADAAQKVAKKEAAMTLMGTWIIGHFDYGLNMTQGVEYDYFRFPIIQKEIPVTALGPIDGIVLPKGGNIKKAETVLSIFTQSEVQAAMSSGSGALSPAKSVKPPVEAKIQRRIHAELQTTPHWAFNYDLATPPAVAELGLALFGDFLKSPGSYSELLDTLEQKRKTLNTDIWK